jgi:hypothetical protein
MNSTQNATFSILIFLISMTEAWAAGKDQIVFRTYPFKIKIADLAGPGPNQFSSEGVKLSDEGHLELRFSKSKNGQCSSSEVVSEKALGFGHYSWRIEGNFGNYPRNAVFGVFIYDFDDNHEYDVLEISKWGEDTVKMQCAAHSKNKTYSVSSRELASFSQIDCELDYSAKEIFSICRQELEKGRKTILLENRFTIDDLPHQSKALVHFNLWSRSGKCESSSLNSYAKILDFKFTPIDSANAADSSLGRP